MCRFDILYRDYETSRCTACFMTHISAVIDTELLRVNDWMITYFDQPPIDRVMYKLYRSRGSSPATDGVLGVLLRETYSVQFSVNFKDDKVYFFCDQGIDI